jgi:hypothetical protein
MNTGKVHVHFDCCGFQEPSMAHKIEGTSKRPPPKASVIGRDRSPEYGIANESRS